jgi:hypothetical protein
MVALQDFLPAIQEVRQERIAHVYHTTEQPLEVVNCAQSQSMWGVHEGDSVSRPDTRHGIPIVIRRAPLLAPYNGLRLEVSGSTPSVITLKHRQQMHVSAVGLELLITLVHPMSSRVHPDPAGLPAAVAPPTTQPNLNHLSLHHRVYCVQHRGIAVVTSPGVKCQEEGCGIYLPHTYHQCQDCNQDTRQAELTAHFCSAHWYLRPQNS